MDLSNLSLPTVYYDAEEWRIINEAFDRYATNCHPISLLMRADPRFEEIKESSQSLRLELADKRYLYRDSRMLYEKQNRK